MVEPGNRGVDVLRRALADGPDPGGADAVARAFRALVEEEPALPAPGGGETRRRFETLAAVAAESPAVARLYEAHTDARAILEELGGVAPAEALLGVWAAEPPGSLVEARDDVLRGAKPYASGARILTHALVSTRTGDERALYLVPAAEWRIEDTWHAVGMAGVDSPTVHLDCRLAPASRIGEPGAYLARAGFWQGGAGVAACWIGGARGIVRTLAAAVHDGLRYPHPLAHLGALDASLAAAEALQAATADAFDDDPLDEAGDARRLALRLRLVAESVAGEAIERVGRALGPGPLVHDRGHARAVADLALYVRQSHAERDMEALGELAEGVRR